MKPANRWIVAARPKTLLASLAPVSIGTALAVHDRCVHWPVAMACLLGAMAIQIGTNFCNDYFDFVQGADTSRRKGPTRAVASGLISPAAMWRATWLMFLLALAIAGYLVTRGGWPMAILGLVSVGCGVWYTAGRFSLAYMGWGDLFALVFFGPVAVAGTYYVQAGGWHWDVAMAGLAPGLLSMALLVVNNLRDIDEDRMAGKRTLAVRYGANFSRWQYGICMVVAHIIPFGLWRMARYPASCLLACLPLLMVIPWLSRFARLQGTALNPALGVTAFFLALFALLFSVGVIWG